MKRAFTLIELMLVVGIMGLMGTISVGGYRAMRRGMEERGVMQNVNQFIRNAYQRAMIDRQPTAIYFWNETRREENEDSSESLLVVGRAVAVRRAGRVSYVGSGCLVDEFGDLRFIAGRDEDGDDDGGNEASNGMEMFLYKVNGDEGSFQRSTVGQATMTVNAQRITPMMTDPEWVENNQNAQVTAYGYKLKDQGGISWKAGDAYGFEFADLTLPNNYIFGKGDEAYNDKSSDSPIKEVGVLHFSPESNASGQMIDVAAIRPGKTGAPEAKAIGRSLSADSDLSKQND